MKRVKRPKIEQKMRKRGRQSTLWKDIKVVLKHTKRCSTIPIIREMQIKTAPRCHFSPTRFAKIKKYNNTFCWWACKETATIVSGNANWCDHLGGTWAASGKALYAFTFWPSSTTSRNLPLKTHLRQYENTYAQDY